MAVRIRHITVDCGNPYELALFWGAVTGFQEEADGPNEPGEDEALLVAPDESLGILFVQVPEGKTVKNRIHLDFQPVGTTRDAEVERILALGATVADDRREPDGKGWVVLADPEGNEFCIERSAAERTP